MKTRTVILTIVTLAALGYLVWAFLTSRGTPRMMKLEMRIPAPTPDPSSGNTKPGGRPTRSDE